MIIENKTFDEERALYGSRGVTLRNCTFDGPADGESACKESSDIVVENSFFNLRYWLVGAKYPYGKYSCVRRVFYDAF